MRIAAYITAFLAGVLIAGTFTAYGHGKGTQAKTWKMASVDEGVIQRNFYNADIATSGEKTSAEVSKRTSDLLNQGYEPYAATTYNNGVYSNMRVWFFRKLD